MYDFAPELLKQWNPRYVVFARVKYNQEPGEVREGKTNQQRRLINAAFMAWNSRQLGEYKRTNPGSFSGETLVNQNGYTAWLLTTWKERK